MTSTSEGFTTTERIFSSFSQAANEAAESRLFGGIHFRFDNQHGLENGMALGQFAFVTQLQAIPEPSSLVLFAAAAAVLVHFTRRRGALEPELPHMPSTTPPTQYE